MSCIKAMLRTTANCNILCKHLAIKGGHYDSYKTLLSFVEIKTAIGFLVVVNFLASSFTLTGIRPFSTIQICSKMFLYLKNHTSIFLLKEISKDFHIQT
jgi:hypothetical protein